jgi:hypothetical protein
VLEVVAEEVLGGQAAAAEREARERQNIGDLAEFLSQAAKAEEVDAWLSARIDKLRQEADERRRRHRVAAAKALAALRSRGESVESIAGQAGVTSAKVREYLKLATTDGAGKEAGGEQEPPVVPAADIDRDSGRDLVDSQAAVDRTQAVQAPASATGAERAPAPREQTAPVGVNA